MMFEPATGNDPRSDKHLEACLTHLDNAYHSLELAGYCLFKWRRKSGRGYLWWDVCHNTLVIAITATRDLIEKYLGLGPIEYEDAEEYPESEG